MWFVFLVSMIAISLVSSLLVLFINAVANKIHKDNIRAEKELEEYRTKEHYKDE